MDSYNFHFERMSNVDLHPLSLPVSRLSPAKSNSSIVDQLTHHQHGKGDSAYSSFSGGSTAPDYPSPFLPDDLQPSSFNHYADLKYVKAIYHPSQVLQSNSKTMDQLYRSMEVISQQYRQTNNADHNSHNGNAGHTNNNTFCNQEATLVAPSQNPYAALRPPPPPARLDSFIATRNLENSWQKSTNILSRSPPRGMSQTEHPKSRQPANSCGHSGDHYTNNRVSGNHFEGQRKRAHSAHNCLGPEPIRAASTWNVGQNFINSSIQHKGQFYFVTGVCKRSETGVRTQSASPCVSEAESESSTVVETHLPREKERGKARCHSTMDNLFRPLQERPHTYSDIIPNDTQCQDPVSGCQDVENQRPSSILTQSSRSFDALEQLHMTQNREIGRHTANNPIFYCGPEKNCHQSSTPQAEEVISLISNEQPNNHKREDQVKRGRRQPLGDVPSERINKETTPLLYHLTGASRVALKPKKDDFSMKGKEAILNKTGYVAVTVNGNERSPQGEMDKEDRGEVISHVCNTIDDSFKKYYKERLKDAQSKVLRETSFKRRDLQLSWPHRVRQKPELRPMVIHAFSSSQDSETSTDTLTASKESEKVNGRPVNVAQPQVARIGGRRRLTPEQKKMCYSEPEKLNQLGGTPNHSSCRSLGNDTENFFAEQYEGKEPMQEGEQGLVAARRKMFETRGRALSASSLSKTNLKHLQHKALVEYMERKTGQKVAEPQQPGSQLPPPPRQRHSLGEKPFDWVPRPLSGCPENKSPKKKLHRPHSAGRILDSSTSSIRYAQFLSAHSGSVKSGDQSHQPNWRENKHPSQGKSASVESLVDQPEPPSFFRNRSTSTPHAFQVRLSPFSNFCGKKWVRKVLGQRCVPAPEGQQRVRVVAQRGKSMEELGTSKHTRPLALSKSTEQLDQLSSRSARPGGMLGLDREKRSMSLFRESLGGKAQGQEGERGNRVRTSPSVTASEREQSVDEPSIVTTPCDSNQEVSLSCGVTTDPSLWILPPEEGIKEDIQNTPLTDDVFADESTSSAPPAPKSEISVSPSTSVSDADTCQHVEGEKDPETEEERAGESQGIEERGTPEGEMESPEKPAEKPQWEELVEAVVKADQSLTRVLYPLANRKTALMLMEQLLSEDTLLMEEHYKKKQEQRGGDYSIQLKNTLRHHGQLGPLLYSSIQNKYLLSCIEERLRALEETRAALQVEIRENMARGEVLEVLVREHCLPVELERYNLFIGDLERVVSLLLCLSARLARVQNALSTVDQHTDAEEKQSLDNRHRLLCKQREDAKDLKDNLDRRESLVSTFLSRQLSAEQLQDYRRFVQTKASLLIRQKDLEEKQRLGEEQLEALHGSPNL
uniref:Shroom family member 1 n=1 Tax=Myripristis murdjan TaxID=586833 RepID=A0A667XB19_9TELE